MRCNHSSIMDISIHALHEESDWKFAIFYADIDISIHALHEESDLQAKPHQLQQTQFQSTLSMRRATHGATQLIVPDRFQSTLSMRRATRIAIRKRLHSGISIHALHEESDVLHIQRN